MPDQPKEQRSIRLTLDELATIEQLAKAEHRTFNGQVRKMLREALDARAKKASS